MADIREDYYSNFGANTIVGIDMSGRAVDMESPYLASGYYLYGDDYEGGACPEGMRAGKMVIRGAGDVDTCAGIINTLHLPDIFLVDYRFKNIIRMMMIASIVLMLIAIIK
jgi:hypothetical protein